MYSTKGILADHLLTDLFTYCRDGINYRLYEEPHRKMAAEFESHLPPPPDQMRTAEQTYFAYAAPRETLKTSIGIQGLAEYFLLKWKRVYNYDGRVLIVRSSREDSQKVLMAVREDLSNGNPTLQKAFGDLSIDSPLWKESAIVLNNRTTNYREASIDTAGTGMSKTGNHFDLILLDDLVNEKNFESEVEMMRARRYIQACMPILNAWGSMILIGTRWANQDVHGFVLDLNEQARINGEPEPWKVSIHGAYDSDGKLFYPAYLTQKKLEQKRRGMEEKLFTSQYLNVIVSDSSMVFRPEWLTYYDGDYEPDAEDIATLGIWNDDNQPQRYAGAEFSVNAAIIIDPAATATNHSNSTGMALALMDAEKNLWIHDCWKGREVPSQILERIVSWCSRYRPRKLSIDTLGQQVLWIDPIQRLLREAGLNVQVILHKGRAVKFNGEVMKASSGILSKASRIESLQPWFREGKLYLRRGHCEPIVHEYTFYTGPTHREHYDMLDALAQAPVVCTPPNPEQYEMDFEMAEMLEEFADEAREPRKVLGSRTGREGRRSPSVL